MTTYTHISGRLETLKSNDRYSLKTILGLSIIYYLAIIAISFGTVYLEFSYAKVIDTEISWFFFLPWSSNLIEVNPVLFACGITIAIAGCLLLWRWHSSVLSKNAEEYTKRWKVIYNILLIISVILCLFAEISAYFLEVFDSKVKYGGLLLPISFLTVPILMIIPVINRDSGDVTI